MIRKDRANIGHEAIAVIQRKIKAAAQAGDLRALTQLRQRLIIVRPTSTFAKQLSLIMRPILTRLESAIANDRPQDIVPILETATQRTEEWFEQTLVKHAGANVEEFARDVANVLNPSQLRARTGLGVDKFGKLKPRPGIVPSIIRDTTITRRELLSLISPFLVVPDSNLQEIKTPKLDVVFPEVKRESFFQRILNGSRRISADWRDKLRILRTGLFQAGREAIAFLQRLAPKQIIAFLREKLGLGDKPGYARSVINELRHEILRVKGSSIDEIIDQANPTVFVGYVLHSRFLDTTAPDHASRDGARFYRDNRSGSFANWEQRLIPPYRKNCVCFINPILENPTGIEFHADFGIQASQNRLISLRDAGTFSEWFNAQSGAIQRKIMGDKRWFAAAASNPGPQRYSHFVNRDGSLVGIRRLLAESIRGREKRSLEVEVIFEIQRRQHLAAWERFEGRFGTNHEEEATYRRNLDRYLENLSR